MTRRSPSCSSLRRDFQTSTGVKSASASAVTDVGLEDPTLLRDACYVGGQWVGASSGAVIDVTNPATGDLIATVPSLSAEETERAIEAASSALKDWSGRTAKERSQIMWKWYNLIIE
eukprot:CAMPEP_0198222010 /NCGR_PEP_ID=MMETSP1445-20131203/86214_1 /TAXON_ID=36898 /ORGANISM="Pyramimonas sp., Strain CCMP2087" /LENGTH=116 /DNA_ID=CAMNT_0043900353 /DNA_START=51 /DNA_END=398 /DNA_ORIENTATION=+